MCSLDYFKILKANIFIKNSSHEQEPGVILRADLFELLSEYERKCFTEKDRKAKDRKREKMRERKHSVRQQGAQGSH